jgi:hypothetical protein
MDELHASSPPGVKVEKPHGPTHHIVVKNLVERNHTGTLTLAAQGRALDAASGLRTQSTCRSAAGHEP